MTGLPAAAHNGPAFPNIEYWEAEFRAAAKLDACRLLKEHLERLACEGDPSEMVEATVGLVQACVAYAGMDGQEERFANFLRRQTYDPAASLGARYLVTFDLIGAFARVLVAELGEIDLADLFNHPWNAYRIAGFRGVYISRCDSAPLSEAECSALEQDVERDIYFDYGDEEVSVVCYPETHFLHVTVHETSPDDFEEAVET